MNSNTTLDIWTAEQINSNLFEGCTTQEDIESLINSLEDWDYEFTREEAIATASKKLL